MKAVDKNAGILRYALNDNIAMATLLSGLGNDGRRKPLLFNYTAHGSRVSPIQLKWPSYHRLLDCRAAQWRDL